MDYEPHPRSEPVSDADSAPAPRTGPFVVEPSALVREVVFHVPGASRAMERFRLDYCCGGSKSLTTICEESRVDVSALIAALEEEKAKGGETDQQLLETPLVDLIARIVREHHEPSRKEGERLIALANAARDAYGAAMPELGAIAKDTAQLFGELLPHLKQEERVLFPYVRELEEAGRDGKPAPVALFATIKHVIHEMEHEHEDSELVMARLRRAAKDYAVSDATPSEVRALYEGLDAHERDLVRHMHLEGNVVFPRAERLETKLRRGARH
jgi:regulator of cell morphogenesis and NO signaling